MGIRNIWSIICKSAHIDARTQLLSLIDIIEKITINIDLDSVLPSKQKEVASLPLKKPLSVRNPFTIVSFWEIPPKERGVDQTAIISVFSPSNKKLASGKIKFTPGKSKQYHRTIFEIPALPITEAGTYSISVGTNQNPSALTVPIIVDINVSNPQAGYEK